MILMDKDQQKVWEILENGPKTWTATVVEDPDDSTECILSFPAELMERLGWKEGDTLHIDTTETGSILLWKI